MTILLMYVVDIIITSDNMTFPPTKCCLVLLHSNLRGSMEIEISASKGVVGPIVLVTRIMTWPYRSNNPTQKFVV